MPRLFFDRLGAIAVPGAARSHLPLVGWLADWLEGSGQRQAPEKEAPPSHPAILAVTHFKAGSSWLHKILRGCVPHLIVPPKQKTTEYAHPVIEAGKIYPQVFVTREEFQSFQLPAQWRKFVIIRDLRDTMVSLYFSIKISHKAIEGFDMSERLHLQSLSQEEGLLRTLDKTLPYAARIQESWVRSGEPLLRYEDLLDRDLEILEPLLLDRCGLPVERSRFREVVLANRFESLTKGRARGQEDVSAHERKGIAGDWRNYFTPEITRRFKAGFGDLLIAAGYEKDSNW
jgi:lipopolysaccharide transport system ATP-binding protein